MVAKPNEIFFKTAEGKERTYLNPGTLSKLHKEAMKIQPKWLEGFHVGGVKFLARNIQMFGGVNLSTMNNLNGTHMGCEFQTADKRNDSLLGMPSIFVAFNPYNCSSKFVFVHHLLDSVKLKFMNFSSLKPSGFDETTLKCDWFRGPSTISFLTTKVSDQFFMSNLSYLRNISKNMTLGTEFNCIWKHKSEAPIFEHSVAARYMTGKSIVALSAGLAPLKFDVSYFMPVTDKLKVGSSTLIYPGSRRALSAIFLQYDLYDSMIRAKLETNGTLGMTYEKQFDNFQLVGSVLMNAKTNKVVVGFKFEAEL